MEQDKNKSAKKDSRLGIDYELEGIDPRYVESFAKIYRIIGVLIVVAFVLWGLNYSWSEYSSPFEMLAREFGASYSKNETWAYVIAVAFFVGGYYFRFTVGSLFAAIFFKSWNLLNSLFKRI